MENVVYVDSHDNPIGAGSLSEAKEKGIICRVSRVFLSNANNEVLLQKRGPTMRSFPGSWDHSAAGHVDEGESYEEAAYRELKEEIGIDGVQLKEISKIYVEEDIGGGLVKKNFSKIYTGTYDGLVVADKVEVSDTKWIAFDELARQIEQKSDDFTPGFIQSFKELQKMRD